MRPKPTRPPRRSPRPSWSLTHGPRVLVATVSPSRACWQTRGCAPPTRAGCSARTARTRRTSMWPASPPTSTTRSGPEASSWPSCSSRQLSCSLSRPSWSTSSRNWRHRARKPPPAHRRKPHRQDPILPLSRPSHHAACRPKRTAASWASSPWVASQPWTRATPTTAWRWGRSPPPSASSSCCSPSSSRTCSAASSFRCPRTSACSRPSRSSTASYSSGGARARACSPSTARTAPRATRTSRAGRPSSPRSCSAPTPTPR
mmetsp:Transcript_31196/g.79679  ORF Transcript_31196/g.79679 Transcript_31196/m.79679 type:complete len:260 (+) Transcript_31196:185-964(+)